MLTNKKLFYIFVPALLVVAATFMFQIIKYEPLYPKENKNEEENIIENSKLVPLFSEDPVIGNPKSPTTIIAFQDFACTSCKDSNAILEKLIEKYPNKIKVVWKGLPVAQFPYSTQKAHILAYCANQQGYFKEFQSFAFANSDNLSNSVLKLILQQIDGLDMDELNSCLESKEAEKYIENTKTIAQVLNIQSVPTFFVDNQQIAAPKTLEGWKTFLDLD